MIYKYKLSILGGTFDRFHAGHKFLIDEAFRQSEKVMVGIAASQLLENKFLSNIIEDYKIRESSAKEYLREKQYLSRSSIVPIYDFYGNSLREKDIQAVFVTRLTFSNARILNFQRRKIGLNPLEIILIPLLKGNDGKIITSERIRYGETDRFGNSYMKVFKDKKRLVMPEALREELRKPQGQVCIDQDKIKEILTVSIKSGIPLTIAVGDIVSKLLVELGYQPDICIIDFKTRRKPIEEKDLPSLFTQNVSFQADNQPGSIMQKTVNIFKKSLKKYFETGKKQIIVIQGEEDLLTLTAILLAPLCSLVFYGQHEVGTITVKVTEQKKKEIEGILKKFN